MSRQARGAFFVAILLLMSYAPLPAQQAPKVPTEQEQEGGHDDPRGREEWFLQGRTVPGKSAAELRLRAFRQKMTARAAAAARTAAAQRLGVQVSGAVAGGVGPQWQNLGPAPIISTPNQSYGAISGRLTSVAVDQTDATGNTVYIGAAYGGLWKSTNAAAADPTAVTWTALTEDQASLAIGAIAISPADHNLLLVGTGEANGSGDSYYGVGILRSTDGGGTWALITSADGGSKPFRGLAVSHIAFSTDNPSVVVVSTTAAGHGTNIGAETSGGTTASRGLYYSTDAGQTWHFVSLSDSGTALGNNSAHSVVYNPIQKKFYAVVRAHGVYSSSDGQAWTKLATQPGGVNATSCPPGTDLTTCPIYRGEFGIRPGSDEMYLWFVNAPSTNPPGEVDGGIFRTLDGGQTWTSLHTGGGSDGISSCGDGSSCGTSQGGYNLYMAAVPNPSPNDPNQTDVYAGAINIYKCTIPGSNKATSTCSTWLNLTHAYSCTPTAAPAHVHPDQHGIDFSRTNPHIIYFGHDGGVSRTLNGPGLNSGACSGHNPFDNLTGTLGSTSEFNSISQDPNNDGTILGGTQDNGSPALFSGFAANTNGVTWNQVSGGDGGYNEIDPNSTSTWYASNTRVSILKCTAGTACTDPQFATVVGPANVGGDTGLFYMPFLLDPQATTSLIVGTCRVWRGVVTGTSFAGTALSNNLSNPASTAACTTSDDLVRAVAAGGPSGGGGSQVIYAGTTAGRIFVTTSAASGPSSWVERTNGINPSFYPISSFYVDPADSSGQTAYVTVMGFGTGHIFKTTSAGASWTQMDAAGSGLPDSPADSVIVDPITPNIVYVGTDVGVFYTRDGTTWSEYGAGLPNVPVSRLRVFNNCGLGKFLLRASTYGRGVWQVPLASVPAGTDYTLGVAPSAVSVFPGQSGTFNAVLQGFNGYTSQVTLSCTSASPSTCVGGQATPSGCGATFALRASDTRIQDFNFTIQGVGSDAGATTHTQAVTLRVVDFAVSKPASFNVLAGGSAATPLTVSGLGSFTGTVTLSCSTLSSNVTCSVFPSSVNPLSASPAVPILTATAASGTTVGAVSATVSATSPGAPAPKTQTFNINVTDFAVSATTTTQTVRAGSPATYTIGLAPVTGSAAVDAVVTLACSGLPSLASCSFDKTSYTPGTGTTATMTITTTAAGAGQPGSTLALWWLRLPVLGLVGAGFLPRDRKRRRSALLLMCLVAVAGLLIIQASCGGGGGSSSGGSTVTRSPGTPAGTYSVTVTAASIPGTASHSTTVTLVVQ